MAIKKVLENGKPKYEVIVKVRDKSGKQITRKKKWFFSEVAAKKAEFEFRMELEGHRTKVTWKKWIERVLEKYRIEYRTSTYFNYKHCLNKWFDPYWNDRFVDEIKPSDVHKAVFETAAETSRAVVPRVCESWTLSPVALTG